MTRVYVKRGASAPAPAPSPAQRRTNAHWLRAQLRDLAFDLALHELDNVHVVRALGAIADGRDWRTAT